MIMIDKEQAEEYLKALHKKDFERLLIALGVQNHIVNDFGFDVDAHYSPGTSTLLLSKS